MKIKAITPWEVLYFGCVVSFMILFLRLSREEYSNWQDRSCSNALLNSGVFGSATSTNWVPEGCDLQNYTRSEIHAKILRENEEGKQNNFAFMGDSRMRTLYYASEVMLSTPILNQTGLERIVRYGLFLHDSTLNVTSTFYWNGCFNFQLDDLLTKWRTNGGYPKVFVIGLSLHCMIFGHQPQKEKLQNYKNNLTMIVKDLEWLSKKSLVIWYVQPPVNYKIFDTTERATEFQYLKNGSTASKKYGRHYIFRDRNTWLSAYNAAAKEVLLHTHVKWWGAVSALRPPDEYTNYDHLSLKTNIFLIQAIFNIMFNKKLEPGNEDLSGLCCRHLIYNKENLTGPLLLLISILIYFTPNRLITNCAQKFSKSPLMKRENKISEYKNNDETTELPKDEIICLITDRAIESLNEDDDNEQRAKREDK